MAATYTGRERQNEGSSISPYTVLPFEVAETCLCLTIATHGKVAPGPDSEKPAAEKKAKASPGPDSEKPAAEKKARASQTADYIKTAASTPDQATGNRVTSADIPKATTRPLANVDREPRP